MTALLIQPRTKDAGYGGSSLDKPIEEIFANLARISMRDRSPMLTDYEIGFQLIDKNDEGDRAAGLLGYEIGKQTVECIMIFNNGRVEGHDQLYLPDQDIFIPNEEKWTAELINRRPIVIGKPFDKQRAKGRNTKPNLYELLRPYGMGKIAEEMPEWAESGLKAFARAVTKDPFDGYQPMLPDAVRKFGVKSAEALIEFCYQRPKLVQRLQEMYGDSLDKAIKDAIASGPSGQVTKEAEEFIASHKGARPLELFAGLRARNLQPKHAYQNNFSEIFPSIELDWSTPQPSGPKHPLETGELKIFKQSDLRTRDLSGVDEATAERLRKFPLQIVDKRAEEKRVTKAYIVNRPLHMHSVRESGIHDVLVNHTDFEKMVVLSGLVGAGVREPWAVATSVKGGAFTLDHPSRIFVNQDAPYTKIEFEEWIAKLPKAWNYKFEKYSTYMLVNDKGDATMPFSIENINQRSKDCHAYRVSVRDPYDKKKGIGGDYYPLPAKATSQKNHRVNRGEFSAEEEGLGVKGRRDCFGRTTILHILNKKGAALQFRGNEWWVPADVKVLELKDNYGDDKPIELGTIDAFKSGLRKEASILNVYEDRGTVFLNGQSGNLHNAFAHLVCHYGLRAKDAAAILDEAIENAKFRGEATEYYLKHADFLPYDRDRTRMGPDVPEYPKYDNDVFGQSIPTSHTQEMLLGIPEISSRSRPDNIDLNRPPEPPNPNVQNVASRAAQMGQKEILDGSAALSIIRQSGGDDDDEALDAAMHFIDRLGRKRLQYAYHPEEYKDRYGDSDFKDLRNVATDAFHAAGDFAMFLKQKKLDIDFTSDFSE